MAYLDYTFFYRRYLHFESINESCFNLRGRFHGHSRIYTNQFAISHTNTITSCGSRISVYGVFTLVKMIANPSDKIPETPIEQAPVTTPKQKKRPTSTL